MEFITSSSVLPEPINKRFRPTLIPDLDILTHMSNKFKGFQDEKIGYNPDVFVPIEQRFNITSKKFGVIPCEFRDYKDTKKHFLVNLEPMTLFNNLIINIPNPNNLRLNDLLQSIIISNGGSELYRINGDIETHISVLGHFLNSSYRYDPITLCTEISFGLIYSTGLLAKWIYYDLVFELETTTPNPSNIVFKADLYTAKEFDGTDPWVSSDPTDTCVMFCGDQRRCRKFLMNQIQSNYKCKVNKKEYLPFNHPVNLIYLTSIDPNIVESICLTIYGEQIIQLSRSELLEINRNYYSIYSDQIILVINPNMLTSNNSSINFSQIDNAHIEVKTTQQNLQSTFTINMLSTNMLGITTDCQAWHFFYN